MAIHLDIAFSDHRFCASAAATVSTSATECQRYIHGSVVNHSGGYNNDEYCTWDITCAADYVVRTGFTSFNTEQCCDKVTIHNGHGNTIQHNRYSGYASDLLQTHSGETLPTAVSSHGSNMAVIFQSDSSTTEAGFAVNFTCGPGVT